jgi:NADPH:quinone reductase-like Zn-dependent oxidoreductase
MKAAICTAYGNPEVIQIQDVPKPIPKENEILVKIIASAVNSGDVRVRSLNVKGILKILMRMVLGITKPRKPILGTTFAGVVVQKESKVSKFKTGDKVFGMTGFNFGTHAEYIAVHQKSNVLQMPHNASFEEAAAIIFGGQTALYFLSKAKISERNKPKVLIMGATGSVGCTAVQIAKYYNAEVTAVCSSKGQKFMNDLVVNEIIFYDKMELTEYSEKFDIILDAVGKYSRKQCKHLLNNTGIYVSVSIGYASENLNQLKQLKAMYEEGALKPTIDKTFTLDEIVEAHRYVESGRKKGNVVLKIE